MFTTLNPSTLCKVYHVGNGYKIELISSAERWKVYNYKAKPIGGGGKGSKHSEICAKIYRYLISLLGTEKAGNGTDRKESGYLINCLYLWKYNVAGTSNAVHDKIQWYLNMNVYSVYVTAYTRTLRAHNVRKLDFLFVGLGLLCVSKMTVSWCGPAARKLFSDQRAFENVAQGAGEV